MSSRMSTKSPAGGLMVRAAHWLVHRWFSWYHRHEGIVDGWYERWHEHLRADHLEEYTKSEMCLPLREEDLKRRE